MALQVLDLRGLIRLQRSPGVSGGTGSSTLCTAKAGFMRFFWQIWYASKRRVNGLNRHIFQRCRQAPCPTIADLERQWQCCMLLEQLALCFPLLVHQSLRRKAWLDDLKKYAQPEIASLKLTWPRPPPGREKTLPLEPTPFRAFFCGCRTSAGFVNQAMTSTYWLSLESFPHEKQQYAAYEDHLLHFSLQYQ